MARNKPSTIPHYELLYIISNKYSEDELRPFIDKVNNIIKDNEGHITYSEEWGKKKLVYPIKHFNYGYYNLVEFDVDGRKIEKINKSLRMFNAVLRYQIVTKTVKTSIEIKKEKEISEKIATKAVEREKLEKEKTKGKVDLKDLDEKLDKILETDDLL